MTNRHRWGDPARFDHKTERACLNGCGIIKVTRHEGRQHWIEFWREGAVEPMRCERTPPCEVAA